MIDQNGIITIDTSQVAIIKKKAGEIVLSAEAEQELRKVLEFKKLADSLYDFVQEKLSEAMSERKLKKVISGNIVVRYSTFGERYQVGENTKEAYTKEVVYRKANPDTIDQYVASHGELPDGVKLKERSSKATISFRNEE